MPQAKRIAGYDELNENEFAYWTETGGWYLNLPGRGVATLRKHEVTEHEDGTITASPSIKTWGHDENGNEVVMHGYLERGVWRDC
jgi:hypothetical protein